MNDYGLFEWLAKRAKKRKGNGATAIIWLAILVIIVLLLKAIIS